MFKSTFLKNENETQNFGAQLAQTIKAPCILFLEGDLGSGKTTFVKGFLRGLGYLGSVKSPTYTLVEEYEFPSEFVYHFDLYRISNAEELEFMGIREYLKDNAIVLIEWPERGQGILPESDISLRFEIAKENENKGRLLTITSKDNLNL